MPGLRIVTKGLGGPAFEGLVTVGLGSGIVESIVRIIRGGRTVARDIYGDKLEEFKIVAALVAINGKDILKPIFNREKYTSKFNENLGVKVKSGKIKKRKKNIFNVVIEAFRTRRGSDGDN